MTQEYLERFKRTLTDHRHHVTQTRLAVFQVFINSQPQTIGTIIKKASPQVHKVSVYRNIELFEKLGIIHRVYMGWKYKLELSEAFTGHHHHLTCLNCNQVIDIQDERHLESFIRQVSAQYGFEPKRHQFEIAGYCEECRNHK